MIEPCPELSLQRQCELIGISRSGIYYEPVPESPENLALMRRLDELHLEHPVYGSRRLTALLEREGRLVNRKRVSTGRRHAGENLDRLLRSRQPELPAPLQMCDGLTRN